MQLQHTEFFLNSIIENLPNMLFVKDAKTLRFERCNKAGEELLGMGQEEIIGKNDFDFFAPEEATVFMAKDLEVLSEKKLLDIAEETIHTKTKGSRIIHTKKIPILDDEGDPQYILVISEDITERKQAELALQQQFLKERLVGAMQKRIRSSLNLEEVLQTAVDEVRQFLSTDRTIIYRFNPNWSGVVVVESVGTGWLSIAQSNIDCCCLKENYHTLDSEDKIYIIEDINNSTLNSGYLNLLHKFQVQASLVIPIWQNSCDSDDLSGELSLVTSHSPSALSKLGRKTKNQLWGMLIVHHCRSTRQWNSSEIESLQQLSVQLAIAIQQCTLFEQARTEILERKLAEQKLRHSNTRYTNLAANIPGMIYQFRLDKNEQINFLYISPRCLELYGLAPETVQNNPELMFDVVHPEDILNVRNSIKFSAETLTPWHSVYRIIIGDKIKWLQGDSRPEKQADGSIIWDGLVIDISDRKRAETELRHAKESADIANRAKSEFLANMSHELRTPLNAILGFSQIMSRDSSLSSEHQKNLEIINRSGEHLLQLINDILEMSKIEAGKITLNENSFDLLRLVENLADMLRLKAVSKGLDFRIEWKPDIPQYIHTDESKLRQILINLLGNAIKFTDKGTVTLQIQNGDLNPDLSKSNFDLKKSEFTHYLIFEVIDTGPGIPPDEIDKLFEAFVQTEMGRQSQQGTGLGLPISQKFVEMMGGNITVSSAVGIGSKFTFNIRVNQANLTDIATSKPQAKVIGLAPDQPEYRILVVEDRLESRLLMVKLLTSVGFSVREATNGLEAITCWETWEPQLIWMDMRMPVMNGYEATKRIKAHLKGQATVIIALTASAFEEQRNLILSVGCDDFMRKPFRDSVIFEKIAQYLGVRYLYEKPLNDTISNNEGIKSDLSVPIHYGQTIRMGTTNTYFLETSVLKEMSIAWLIALYQAANEADADLIFNLAEEIGNVNPILAKTLVNLVNNFQFEQITDVIATTLPPEIMQDLNG